MTQRRRPPDVFLDRDGVIIRNRSDYVKSWAEVEILPGAPEAIAALTRNGSRVIVITNQSAVARGLVSLDTVEEMHRRLQRVIEDAGGHVTAFYVCPHHPDDGCDCRKPRPGLLLRAAREHGIDLPRAYFVGDQAGDMEAAAAAGCTGVLVDPDLAATVRLILERSGNQPAAGASSL